MGLLYREDLLSAAGIEPPKTYDDFATAAATYHSKNPKSYLVNVAPNQPGQIVAYLWQAGVRPFAFDGKQTVKIDLANEEAKKVVKFWGDLVTSGVRVQRLRLQRLLVPGPDQRQVGHAADRRLGTGVPAGSGRARPRASGGPPTFRSGMPARPVSSNWGGSTDAVLKLSKNQIAASQLALFINTDKESALQFATKQFLFPAMNEILTDPTFVDQKSDFYGGQKVNEKFAQISETVSPDFGWLPFMDYVYTNFERNPRQGVRRQDRRGRRPAGLAGRLRQVRQRPGLHGLLNSRCPPPRAAGTPRPAPGRSPMSTAVDTAPTTDAASRQSTPAHRGQTPPVRSGLRSDRCRSSSSSSP